jgi:hypothetical protein
MMNILLIEGMLDEGSIPSTSTKSILTNRLFW